jgi:hypothetical protein
VIAPPTVVLGVLVGMAAAARAPAGQGPALWGLGLCGLTVAGALVVGWWRGGRAAAILPGTLLGFTPAVALAALIWSSQHMLITTEPTDYRCGASGLLPMSAMMLGAGVIGLLACATGRLFALERPALERRAHVAAVVACVLCWLSAAWATLRGVDPPTIAGYFAALPLRGSAGPVRMADADRHDTRTEPLHQVDHVGVALHRSCMTDRMDSSPLCALALGDDVKPALPHTPLWAGRVSPEDALEVRFDDRNGLWLVAAGKKVHAFRDATLRPTTTIVSHVMTGPPRACAYVGALGAGIAVAALLLRRRQQRALAAITAAAAGFLSDDGWIHLDDGRTIRAPPGLVGSSRVLVVAMSGARSPYRDTEMAAAILHGDRADHEARVRALSTAHTLVALAAATLGTAPVVAALV